MISLIVFAVCAVIGYKLVNGWFDRADAKKAAQQDPYRQDPYWEAEQQAARDAARAENRGHYDIHRYL